METITLNINKADVYEEVAKASDYTGSKLIEADKGARDRILMTDADQEELGRFWREASSMANERLKEMFENGSVPSAPSFSLTLKVSVAFDKGLTPSVEASLSSFFVNFIIGKWYELANKGEAEEYMARASASIEGVRRMLYSRKAPVSPRTANKT